MAEADNCIRVCVCARAQGDDTEVLDPQAPLVISM